MLQWITIAEAVRHLSQAQNTSPALDPQFDGFQKGINKLLEESKELTERQRVVFLSLLYSELTTKVIDFRIALGMIDLDGTPIIPEVGAKCARSRKLMSAVLSLLEV